MLLNFIRSPRSVGAALGQWRRWVVDAGAGRRLCSKPKEGGSGQTPDAPAHGSRLGFKVPGYQPSEMDKTFLVWSGRFKTKDQVPAFVSFEMIDSARNKVRVKACYAMIVLTLAACLVMVVRGKQAVSRHESLTGWNMEKKARWREEAQREKEDASTSLVAGKTQ
uniref:Protein FAM162B n=2 Tax=Denticeps clupeoides TaxID=299321 RepID=A0AAY4AWD0_9TELE